MTWVIAIMMAAAFAFGALTGSIAEVSQGAVSGAKQAVELVISIGGTVCLWNGLMEIMRRSGLSDILARLLAPVIRLLFGRYASDREAASHISQNMAANILGLGSAATPSGLKAAKRLHELGRQYNEPPHAVFLLIIINTASLQLLPTTVAAVRASYGSGRPFDILPAVWLTSAVSVLTGITAAKLFASAGDK